jgi:hypothetical protein
MPRSVCFIIGFVIAVSNGFVRGQATAPQETGRSPARAEAREPLEDLRLHRRSSETAREVLVEIMRPREDEDLTGQLLSLEEALRLAHSQRVTARAYWDLVFAVGVRNLAGDHVAWLREVARTRTTDQDVTTARTAAEAGLAESSVRLLESQYALIGTLRWVRADLPLPADDAHVGAYRTQFSAIFPGRAAPLAIQRIQRVLPLRASEIDGRALAVAIAAESMASLEATGPAAQTSFADRLKWHESLLEENTAFLRAVHAYNRDIAEYAAFVAGEGADPKRLAAMMILSKRPRDSAAPVNSPPTPDNDPEKTRSSQDVRTAQRPSDISRVVRRPITTRFLPEPFEAIADWPSPRRAQTLVKWLHEGIELPTSEPSVGMSLEDGLSQASGGSRRQTTMAYWNLVEALAKYGVHYRRLGLLDSLQASSPSAGATATGERKPLLEVQILVAQCDLIEAMQELESREADLASLLGRDPVRDWILPLTPLHGGRFQTNADQGANDRQTSATSLRQADLVHRHFELVLRNTESVLAATQVREASLSRGASSDADLESALTNISREANRGLELATSAGNYNRAFAEYVLATVPGDWTAEQLAASLALPVTR